MNYFKFCTIITMFHFSLITGSMDPSAFRNQQLKIAIQKGNITKVTELLDQGVDPNYKNYKHETHLHQAARKGLVLIVQKLLDHGADPNSQSITGETPLLMAVTRRCSKTKPKVIKALLDRGADPNAQDLNGDTAVHIAVQYKRPTILNTLLEAYPDPFIPNNQGKRASDLVNLRYPVSKEDGLIRTMLIRHEINCRKRAQKERSATACLGKECKKPNTGIFYTMQYLLDTPRYPEKNQ